MNKARIPTILGLGILVISVVVGVFLVESSQSLNSKARQSSLPKEVTITNLSSTSAAVFWQTEETSTGFIQMGTTTDLGATFHDERDTSSPKKYRLHFVTMNNLLPNITYYFKIYSNEIIYPLREPLAFRTTNITPTSALSPLIGTILDINQQPIDEAIVKLQIPAASSLSTITKVGGNFILPLATLTTADLSETYIVDSSTPARLIIIGPAATSTVSLRIPLSFALPPIILGKDLDLTATTSSPSAQTPTTSTYDLNGDGVVNSLDRGIILKNIGKSSPQKEADFNGDGDVDQKDLTLFDQYIKKNVSQ